MSIPRVISLQLHHTGSQPLTSVSEVQALVEHGLQGDSHARREPGRRRQVLILDRTTLDAYGLRPGDLREQITITGFPDITHTPPGAHLRVGNVLFEASGECAPCRHIGQLLRMADTEAFRQSLEGAGAYSAGS